jgi:homoserine O-acetyltransferase/O-succinyltransferase
MEAGSSPRISQHSDATLEWWTQTGKQALDPLPLQSGATLPAAELSWKTYGAPRSGARQRHHLSDQLFSHHTDLENLVGADSVLNATRWFIVVPDMFANGLSSSPSSSDQCPSQVTTADNVRAHQLRREVFGIDRSPVSKASRWERNRPITGRLSFRNKSKSRHRLRQRSYVGSQPGLLAVSAGDAGGGPGAYRRRPLLRCPNESPACVRANLFGLAMSQDWYRADLHPTGAGAANLDDFLDHHWEPGFTRRKAEDLYAQATT